MQESAQVKMHAVKLLKNYRPAGDVEIVGWHRPEVKRKDSVGREIIVTEAAFIKGEAAPPPHPGVGFPDKIWAGTVIKLTEAEARTVKQARIGELEFAD